ncbi:extracellular solute-binding protein [Reinekea forsetii]|jgi:ABC-type glycerol-3-phosphate transport system substrate-binding protein|uniref:Extracellular solute-binding protein n=1 Tax=Reinekea forsetii TaxID=1336806 RepID=A0A2K8KQG0_9GAMM|nr:extracellular solute-binding protein [Reinekea forsetii]ATX76985.1 extracellular solute-binding protein [Reinekea forsetii]
MSTENTPPLERIMLLTLHSTFEETYKNWGLENLADVRVSPTMHDLYLEDFPSLWAKDDVKQKMAVIGPNDYFTKWQSNEFSYFEDTPLSYLLDKVRPSCYEGAKIDGKVCGLPLCGGNHQLMFINRSLTDCIPATFDELLTETWRLRNGNHLLYPLVYPTNASYFALPLLYSTGSPLWSDPDNPHVGITRDSLYEVLKLHKELMYDHMLLPIKWEQYHSVFEFQTRRAAFCFGGDWDIRSHMEVLGEDLIIAPIPSIARRSRSSASCNYLFLSNKLNTDLYASAEQVANKLLSPEVQGDWAKTLFRNPVIKDFGESLAPQEPNLKASKSVYDNAVILPPNEHVSHAFHVMADLFEPGVMVKHNLQQLTDLAIEKMLDIHSNISFR